MALAQEFQQVYPSFETNEMTDICVQGDTLYITTLNWGLLRSTDAGITWQDVFAGMPQYDLLRLVPGMDALFCVPLRSNTRAVGYNIYEPRKLLRVEPDRGVWNEIDVPREFGYCISMDISGDAHALFLLQSGRDSLAFHRSMDGGRTWDSLPLPAQPTPVYYGFYQPAISFRDSLRGVFVHGDNNGHEMYITSDAGRRWTPLPAAPDFGSQLIFVQRPAMCWFDDSGFAFIDQGQVLVYTTNLGATWTRGARVSASLQSVAMRADGRVYAADLFGEVWRSDTFGASWVRIRNEITSAVAITRQYSMCMLGRDTLVLATSEGHIWRTSDGGTSWDDPRPGHRIWAPAAHFVDSAYGWLTGEIGEQELQPGVLRTTDGGFSWERVGRFKADFWPATHFFMNRTTGFILDAQMGGSDTTQSLYRTTDGGDTWTIVREALFRDGYAADELVRGIWYSDSTLIILPARNGGVHRSTDAGNTWMYVADAFDTTGRDKPRCIDARNRRAIWACTRRKLYRSTDLGAHWDEMRVIYPQNPIDGFSYVFVQDANRITVAEYAGAKSSMHTSTDNGATWTMYPTELRLFVQVASLYPNDCGLYLTGDGPACENLSGSRIYKTRDAWRSMEADVWEYRSSTDTRITHAFFLDEKYSWLFSRSGVYRTTNGGVNWTELPPAVPSTADIAEVYPQPAAPNDVLHVRLRNDAGAVRLELRDLLGRLVSVLHDGECADRGTVRWNVDVPAGVYILSLASRSRARARTIIVR